MADSKLAEIEVLVDSREPKDTLTKVQVYCPLARQTQIDVGDIAFKQVAIELKSWVDFINSFTAKDDDRWRRQLYNFYINKDIEGYYIIYGRWEEINEYSQVKMTAILASIASMLARYGIHVLVLPNKDYAIYVALKIIEKTYDRKDVRPVVYKVGTDERAVDTLVAAGDRVGSSDAIRLLEKFGTVKNVVNSNVKEMITIKKIGKIKAENLMKTFTFDFKKKQEFEENMKREMEIVDEIEDKVEDKPVEKAIIDIEADKVDDDAKAEKSYYIKKRDVLKTIGDYSRTKGKPIPFGVMLTNLRGINETELKLIIDDLIRDSHVYEADTNLYDTY